jgi:hypothetical protein
VNAICYLTNPLAVFLQSIRRHRYDKPEVRAPSGNAASCHKQRLEVAERMAGLNDIVVVEQFKAPGIKHRVTILSIYALLSSAAPSVVAPLFGAPSWLRMEDWSASGKT